MRFCMLLAVLISVLSTSGQTDMKAFAGDVFYLAPDEAGVMNVHGIGLEDARGIALTQAGIDLYYYDVAPDSHFLVYAMRKERGGTSELVRLWADGREEMLTDCQMEDADCRRPAISPDGERIAYERMVMNGGEVPDVPEAPEIWLWEAGEQVAIGEGLQPAWDDMGELIYQELDDMTSSTIEGVITEVGGAYLARDEARMRVFLWSVSPENALVLEDEGGYTYTALHDDEDGRWLLLERRSLEDGAVMEILLYDWQSGEYRLLASGYNAQWR